MDMRVLYGNSTVPIPAPEKPPVAPRKPQPAAARRRAELEERRRHRVQREAWAKRLQLLDSVPALFTLDDLAAHTASRKVARDIRRQLLNNHVIAIVGTDGSAGWLHQKRNRSEWLVDEELLKVVPADQTLKFMPDEFGVSDWMRETGTHKSTAARTLERFVHHGKLRMEPQVSPGGRKRIRYFKTGL